ncbi:hypothetical protein BH10PSE9_BH10PSE9_02850 [soil metagenome]
MIRRIATLACAGALAGCQMMGGGGGSASLGSPDDAYLLSTKLAENIGRCWFGPTETAFAGYVYSPERNAGVSRILIVKKNQPQSLPVLVVEAKSSSSADVYGPLAGSATGPRIRADVERWAKGGTGCA